MSIVIRWINRGRMQRKPGEMKPFKKRLGIFFCRENKCSYNFLKLKFDFYTTAQDTNNSKNINSKTQKITPLERKLQNIFFFPFLKLWTPAMLWEDRIAEAMGLPMPTQWVGKRRIVTRVLFIRIQLMKIGLKKVNAKISAFWFFKSQWWENRMVSGYIANRGQKRIVCGWRWSISGKIGGEEKRPRREKATACAIYL